MTYKQWAEATVGVVVVFEVPHDPDIAIVLAVAGTAGVHLQDDSVLQSA